MSNSKLTAEQKQFRKEYMQSNPDTKFFNYPDRGITVAIRETGPNMAQFSVSIASESEVKFRRKVGEYHAATRMAWGMGQPVVKYDTLAVIAGEIAIAMAGN